MKNAVLIFLLLFSAKSFSIPLSEIEKLALDRSSSLTAQEMEGLALRSEANLKGKWQNPQLMGQFGTLKSGSSSEGLTAELSFTQPIPLSDKFSLKKEMALSALESHKFQSEFYKNWVGHQALLSAWKVYVTSELLKHGKERARRLAMVKKYMETRPKVTIKQRVELSIISTTLVQLEREQDQKKHDYQMAKSDLAFWIGKERSDAELSVKLPDQYSFEYETKIDTSKDVELFHAKNNVRTSQIDHDLAAKERRPDVFLGGGYRVEDVVPVNRFAYAIVGLNIPIWDTGSSRVEAASAREKREQKNFEETEKRLMLKHQKQIELVNFSIEQLKRFPKKFIDINENAISEAVTGFKQGLLDVNTFLLAETQSHEVIDQVFVSWINYLENLSTLQLMKGEKLNWESHK